MIKFLVCNIIQTVLNIRISLSTKQKIHIYMGKLICPNPFPDTYNKGYWVSYDQMDRAPMTNFTNFTSPHPDYSNEEGKVWMYICHYMPFKGKKHKYLKPWHLQISQTYMSWSSFIWHASATPWHSMHPYHCVSYLLCP